MPPLPPPGWNQAAADAALAEALARLDAVLTPCGEATTPVRRDVVDTYRGAVARLHARRDPTLLQAPDGVALLLARWRGPD